MGLFIFLSAISLICTQDVLYKLPRPKHCIICSCTEQTFWLTIWWYCQTFPLFLIPYIVSVSVFIYILCLSVPFSCLIFICWYNCLCLCTDGQPVDWLFGDIVKLCLLSRLFAFIYTVVPLCFHVFIHLMVVVDHCSSSVHCLTPTRLFMGHLGFYY